MNLPPDKIKVSVDPLKISIKGTKLEAKKLLKVSRSSDADAMSQNTQNQIFKTFPVHLEQPSNTSPAPTYQSVDNNGIISMKSIFSTQVEPIKQVLESADFSSVSQVLVDDCQDDQSNQVLQKRRSDGLSEQERLEIKQTLKLVYPGLAISQIPEKNHKLSSNKKKNSLSITGENLVIISKTDSAERNRNFTSKNKKRKIDTLDDEFNLETEFSGSLSRFPRFSKMPNANRTFLKPNSLSSEVSHRFKQRPSEDFQQIGFDSIAATNYKLTQSSNKNQNLFGQDKKFLEQEQSDMIKKDSTLSIMHQKTEYGQKKEEKDACTLDITFKQQSNPNELPSSFHNRQLASPEEAHLIDHGQQVDSSQTSLVIQHCQGLLVGKKKKLSNTRKKSNFFYDQAKNDRHVLIVTTKTEGGGEEQNSDGLRHQVSSGEVSLAEKHNRFADSRKKTIIVDEIFSKPISKQFNMTEAGPVAEGSDVPQQNIFSLSQHSQESQMTYMSTDAHNLKPKLGSRCTAKKVQRSTSRKQCPQNIWQGQNQWQPKMRTIAEGDMKMQKQLWQKQKSVTAAIRTLCLNFSNTIPNHQTEEVKKLTEPLQVRRITNYRNAKMMGGQTASTNQLHIKDEMCYNLNSRSLNTSAEAKMEPFAARRELLHEVQQVDKTDSQSQTTKYLNLQSKMTNIQTVERNETLNINKDLTELVNNYGDSQTLQKKNPASADEKNFATVLTSSDVLLSPQMKLEENAFMSEESTTSQRALNCLEASHEVGDEAIKFCPSIKLPVQLKPRYMNAEVQMQQTTDSKKDGYGQTITGSFTQSQKTSGQTQIKIKKTNNEILTATRCTPNLELPANECDQTQRNVEILQPLEQIFSPQVNMFRRKNMASLAPLSGYAQARRAFVDQKDEWHNMQISPVAQNAYNLQTNIQSQKSKSLCFSSYESQRSNKQQTNQKVPCLGELLFNERRDLQKITNIGTIREGRPNVRFLNREHIEGLQITKLNSERTQESKFTPRKNSVESKSGEDCSCHQQSLDLVEPSLNESCVMQQNKTQCSIKAHLSPILQISGQKGKLESVDRIQAFRNTAFNKHCVQPYATSDCKYVLASSVDTFQANLQQFYGMNLSSPSKSGAQTHRPSLKEDIFPSDDRFFKYKKVPLLSKDGHLDLCDVASPNESMYAKRRLNSKRRHDKARNMQQQIRAKQLELGYSVASPAARMRSLLLNEQKKLVAIGKSKRNGNTFLFEDISGLKTWRTCL